MATDTTSRKRPAAAAKRSPEDDHRRKRRNRPTQSCLNCHTSKRMCDRQRPCGRCTQLGLTGLCVYEVDSPQRVNAHDDSARLQKRVAELESIIRELKNKPHPRWAQSGAADSKAAPNHSAPEGSAQGTSSKRPSPSPTPDSPESSASGSRRSSIVSVPTVELIQPSPLLLNVNLVPSSSSSDACSSPLNTPSPSAHSPSEIFLSPAHDMGRHPAASDFELSSLLAACHASDGGIDETFLNTMLDPFMGLAPGDPCNPNSCSNTNGPGPDHCGCLGDHTSYNAVLELSIRLRRATELLSRYAKHGPQSDCRMHKGVSDLDRFTSATLGKVATPPDNAPLRLSPPFPPRQAFGALSPRGWDYAQAQAQQQGGAYPSPPWEDSFMSWEPLRHTPDAGTGWAPAPGGLGQ